MKTTGIGWTVAVATVTCLASIQPARSAFVPTRYEARWTSTPPVVDGQLNDAVWAEAETIDKFFAYKSGGSPAAADASARLLWDSDRLYVAFEVTDVDIRSSCGLAGECGPDARLWFGDVIELFVRESTSSPRYYEFQWSPIGDEFDARFDFRGGGPGSAWDSGVVSAVQVDGTVDQPSDADQMWTVEASIPLSNFQLSTVEEGTEWTFTAARYDYFNHPPAANEELMMSTPGDPDAPMGGVTNGFHTYEIYDILEFTRPVPEPASIVLVGIALILFGGRGWRHISRRG